MRKGQRQAAARVPPPTTEAPDPALRFQACIEDALRAWLPCSPPAKGKAQQHVVVPDSIHRAAREKAAEILAAGLNEIASEILDGNLAAPAAADAVRAILKTYQSNPLPERPREMVLFFYALAIRCFETGRDAPGLSAYESLLALLDRNPSDLAEAFDTFNGPSVDEPDRMESTRLLLAAARAAIKTKKYPTAIAACRAIPDEPEAGESLIKALLRTGASSGAKSALDDHIAKAQIAGDYEQVDRLLSVWKEAGGPTLAEHTPSPATPAVPGTGGKLHAQPFSAPEHPEVVLPDREFLTLREFGVLIRRSPATLRKWIRDGKLRATKPGPGQDSDQWLVPRPEAIRMLKDMGMDPSGA